MTGPMEDPGKIQNLMMVDDNEIDQMLHRRVVTRTGLVGDVHCFQMATDALDFLGREDRPRIDAILLDINMPRMNGFEFLEAATAAYGDSFAGIVVIMLTTSLAPEDQETAARYPIIKDYLNKPLTPEHVERIARLAHQ